MTDRERECETEQGIHAELSITYNCYLTLLSSISHALLLRPVRPWGQVKVRYGVTQFESPTEPAVVAGVQ